MDLPTSQSKLRKKLRAQRKLCRTNPEKCDRNIGSGKSTLRQDYPQDKETSDKQRHRDKQSK